MFKNFLYRILPHRIISVILLFVQIALLIMTIVERNRAFAIPGAVLNLLSLVVCLYIISKRDKGAYKLSWVFLILIAPLFGGFVYLMFSFQSSTRRFAKKIEREKDRTKDLLLLMGDSYDKAKNDLPEYSAQLNYMQNYAGFPVYENMRSAYYSPGEDAFEAMLQEIEKAEKYIFLEFFIVQEGLMWDRLLEVLREKAAKGVKIRLIYDDLGSFFLLPPNYAKTLKKMGIECVSFNPFKPMLTAKQNNRDHRKILVIDGKVAFTGGINIADEYINAIEKFGHWKDSAVKIEGYAAWSFTLMFLQMWEICAGKGEDFRTYYPWQDNKLDVIDGEGYVLPYCDSPMDKENVGEHVYMQIINSAKDYLYISTPYLIIDDSMVSALCLAAKSGVDVRIVTPCKWDKRLVHMTTRSYYRELIKAGVKICEYSKGFIHSKTFVCDDKTATVGTTNLDFRSLYLHFECGAVFYKNNVVSEVKNDFLQMFPICNEITLKECTPRPAMKLFQDILRLFAPFM